LRWTCMKFGVMGLYFDDSIELCDEDMPYFDDSIELCDEDMKASTTLLTEMAKKQRTQGASWDTKNIYR